MDQEYQHLIKQNKKIKRKIMQQAQDFQDERDKLRSQNKSLKIILQQEQAKNQATIEEFTERITALETELRNLQSSYPVTPPPYNMTYTTRSTSFPTIRMPPKSSINFDELELEEQKISQRTNQLLNIPNQPPTKFYFQQPSSENTNAQQTKKKNDSKLKIPKPSKDRSNKKEKDPEPQPEIKKTSIKKSPKHQSKPKKSSPPPPPPPKEISSNSYEYEEDIESFEDSKERIRNSDDSDATQPQESRDGSETESIQEDETPTKEPVQISHNSKISNHQNNSLVKQTQPQPNKEIEEPRPVVIESESDDGFDVFRDNSSDNNSGLNGSNQLDQLIATETITAKPEAKLNVQIKPKSPSPIANTKNKQNQSGASDFDIEFGDSSEIKINIPNPKVDNNLQEPAPKVEIESELNVKSDISDPFDDFEI